MSIKIDKSLILNEIKTHYDFSSDAEFARYLGVKPQTLASWHKRNTYDIDLIYSKCEDIDGNWLLTGKGNKLRISNGDYIQKFELITDDKFVEDQRIPLYNLEATAGLVELFQSHSDTKPIDTIHIPNLPKCDGAVFVTGDSMYPLLKSGDIVAYKQIHDIKNGIFWGEMYLVSINVDSEEYISVKYVQKSDKGEDYIKLVSQNQHHQPKDVLLKNIRAMALVKASVRINSMG